MLIRALIPVLILAASSTTTRSSSTRSTTSSPSTSNALSVTFTSPSANSVFNPGDTVDLNWTSDAEVKDPVFRLCLASSSSVGGGSTASSSSSVQRRHTFSLSRRHRKQASGQQASSDSQDTTEDESGQDSDESEQDDSSSDDQSTKEDDSSSDDQSTQDDDSSLDDQSTEEDNSSSDDQSTKQDDSSSQDSSSDDQDSSDSDFAGTKSSSDDSSDHISSTSNDDDARFSSHDSQQSSKTKFSSEDAYDDASSNDRSGQGSSSSSTAANGSQQASMTQSTMDMPSKPSANAKSTTGNCGAQMNPPVAVLGNGQYSVSLIVPDQLPNETYAFYLQMDDGQNGKARSATISLSMYSSDSSSDSASGIEGSSSSPAALGAYPSQVGAQQPLGNAYVGTTLPAGGGTLPLQTPGSSTPGGSSMAPVANTVASRSPPPPVAALAVPLSLIGGILLVATALGLREARRTVAADKLSNASREDVKKVAQREVPVPLFMHGSLQSLDHDRKQMEERTESVSRTVTREFPLEMPSISNSPSISDSAEKPIATTLPTSLMPAHIRGAAGTTLRNNKELPVVPATDVVDEFEDVEMGEERVSTTTENVDLKPSMSKTILYATVARVVGGRT